MRRRHDAEGGDMRRSHLMRYLWAAAVAVLVVVAVLTLAACGGSDTAASTSPSVAPSQAASSPSAAFPSGIPLPTPTIAGTIAFTRYGEDEWTQADHDIWAVNTDGTDLRVLAGGKGCQMYPRWSPDGSQIVYHQSASGDQDPHQVWVMNADGSGKVQLTEDSLGYRNFFPSWSPDGKRIVFSHLVFYTGGVERDAIYVMNADGSGLRNVTSKKGEGVDYWPTWAKDGKIYFYRLNPGGKPAAEFSVNPDGSGLKRLMSLGDIEHFLKYGLSPNSKEVALHDLKTDRLEVVPVRSGGAPVTLLYPVADYTEDPTVDVSWSPDAKALAIAGLYDSSEWVTRLFIVNADGTGLSAVPGIDGARDPAWRPE
jgi:hypothetical protein